MPTFANPTHSISKLLCAGTLMLAPLACEAGLDDGEGEAALEEATHEIVENLLAAGYPETEIEIDDAGVVIVGGDVVVTLEASRELAGVDAHGFRQYSTNNLVSGSVDTICINGSSFSGDMSTGLDNAINNFNNQGLRFTLVRTSGSSNGCDATITANVIDGTGGSAGFPANGIPYGTINIGDDIAPTHGVGGVTYVIMHELGHAIGLRHSDWYDRSISCGGDWQSESSVGANHIPNTPTGAVYNGSVMNSCGYSNSTGTWTHSDVTALQQLYGGSFCNDYNGRVIALRSAHDHYLRAGDSQESWRLDQQWFIGAWEQFTVECNGAQASLRSAHGRYVRAGSAGDSWYVGQQSNIGDWERLTPVRQPNGTWAFSTYHDRYLRAGNSQESWRVDQQTIVGAWEQFTVVPL